MKITREDIKRFDDIRLVVLSALLGTALSKFDLDPSSTASAIIGITFIMSVILAAYGVHTISITRPYFWSNLYAIGFILIFLIFAVLSRVRGYDLISGFIGIDRRGMFLILVTIFAWIITSIIVKWFHQRLETAAEETAKKVVEEDK
jgi:Zn-dependent protease with chaperone function